MCSSDLGREVREGSGAGERTRAKVGKEAAGHGVKKCDTLVQVGNQVVPPRMSVGTSLVVQWIRIRLPMQGTRVRALVREDPTCRRATKPVRHNY